MSEPLHVGQLVVCHPQYGLRSGHFPSATRPPGSIYPEPGHVYTVKTINEWSRCTLITLVECDNSHMKQNGWEPGFDARHFKPISGDRIAIFRKLLAPTPKVGVDA